MSKLNFTGNNSSKPNSNFEPSIKEYAPKNKENVNSLANLMVDGKISADDVKALKAKATEVMDTLKEAGNPANVTYQAYPTKAGDIAYRLTIAGRDSKEGELQRLEMTLDKDMNITKAFSTKTVPDGSTWKTEVLKGSEYNNFMKNARTALKELLPEAPKRELPPFVKEISEKIREASPKIPNKDGEEVAKYYSNIENFKDKNGTDRVNLVVKTHGDEQLTVTLNAELDGITRVKYTDFSGYDAEKKTGEVKNVVLDSDNLNEVRDTFLHDTVIGDILLSKDSKALESPAVEQEADMAEPDLTEDGFMDIPDGLDEEFPFE